MLPTQAQFDAIHTPRNAIVVAGAGSGKTRVLVERYLRLLEINPDWSLNTLVAITFTRKAASEMRDRVRATLEKKRQSAPDEISIKRWTNLLSQMDSARITTIHALCADLLRANAAEARLDPDFVVLDETEAAVLLSDTLEDAFAQLAQTESPALAVFETYDLRTIRETLAYADFLGQDFDAPAEDLFSQWNADWEQDITAALQRLLTNPLFIQAVEWSLPGGFPPGDRLTEVWGRVQACFGRLTPDSDPNTCLSVLADLMSTKVINLTGGSAKAWGGKDIFEEAKNALKFIREAAAQAHDSVGIAPDHHDQQAAKLIPAWLTLIQQVQTAYQAAKFQQSALDFNDLERLTAALLANNPAVVARYQNDEIHHLLVDEFQDTNAAQWTIAQQLATLPGSLFVVGDPKQSIYAFRGADVSVFHQVRDQITRNNGDQINLSRSFRTHTPLVNRFNLLFQQILTVDDRSPVRPYQVELGELMDAHRAAPPTDDPALELLLIDKKRLEKSDVTPRQWEAAEIAGRLKALYDQQRLIYDKETGQSRPFEYGDTVLLFQSMGSVNLYEAALRTEGIPFITVAGRGYYGRQEIHDLLNLLKALYNPADNLSLASALRSPLFSLSDDCLYALRLIKDEHNQIVPLWDAINLDTRHAVSLHHEPPLHNPSQQNHLIPAAEVSKVAFARDTLYGLQALAGRVTISELLRTTLADTGYLATLTGLPDGALRRGNVEKLLDKAQSSGKITLSDFTAYVSDLSEREVREGDAALDVAGVVRLMTVHASKGLEFPVVVLVDSSWKRRVNKTDILMVTAEGICCKVYNDEGKWEQPFAYRRAVKRKELREEAEKRRLLYVAATRAQDLLIISGHAEIVEDEYKADGWLKWLLEAIPHDDNGIRWLIPPESRMVETRHAVSAALQTPIADMNAAAVPSAPLPAPPLLPAVLARRQNQIRHLAAASIADLGGCFHADDAGEAQAARDRFRRKVLYEAPSTILRVQYEKNDRRGALHVGDIVHEALRWWTLPFAAMDENTRHDLLVSYAWENGVTDNESCKIAVERASDLLTKFSQSQLYRWIRESQENHLPIYRELPFIYERETHIVHGVMDILFKRPNGEWVLADYKTSRLNRHSVGKSSVYDALALHAKRYHLQVGIYAEAAQQHLGGIMPKVFIHYITYATSIEVPAAVWEEALVEGLGAPIAQMIQS